MLVKEKYEQKVKDAFKKEFEIKNSLALPKLEKVVLNVGFGKVSSNMTNKH